MTTPIVQIVTFRLDGMSEETYRATAEEIAPTFRDMPGLLSKVWLADPQRATFGGVYVWRDADALQGYVEGPVWAALGRMPGLADIESRSYGVLEGPTSVTAPYLGDVMAPAA